MTTISCPQEVLDYIGQWEDLEPLCNPAVLTGKDFVLQNVWALWRDEDDNMHAVDYTGGKLRDYVFKGAYPVAMDSNEDTNSAPLVVQDFKFEWVKS